MEENEVYIICQRVDPFMQPLVLDRDNVIVCGHTRYAAAKKLMFTSADKE